MYGLPQYKKKILIVDDEELVGNVLNDMLRDKYDCTISMSAEEALNLIESNYYNLVLTDIDLGGMNGIELVPLIHQKLADAVVVMISGKHTIESAIEAMRVGAFDYIPKPFKMNQVEISVERALNHQALLVSKRHYEENLEEIIDQRTAQINYMAYHDALTDLPNRVLFEDRLTQSLASRFYGKTAVVLLTLKRFKQFQETLGYEAGYKILRETASRLKKFAGKNATVAKLEADEFGLLINNVKGAETVIQFINELNEIFEQPFEIDDREIFISTEIGVSISPDDAENAANLLKNASAALSRACSCKGSNYEFYKNDMSLKALKRLELENNLRRAIERDELRAFYQPIVDINTNRIISMEALIRWEHPEHGLISPAEFIPLAEETGIIVDIGEWVLRTACQQTKVWMEKGYSLNVSVNLSPEQFQQPDLAARIKRIISENSLDPNHIELEVTESSLMRNADQAVKVLSELRAGGIKISVDDFGTGYSSLGYLKNLPIDKLKIDRSFINDISDDPDAAALVMAIISLSHNFRLKVIAEGVETEDQLKFLHLLRCDAWQGYLYSKPVCAGDFEQLLIKMNAQNN